MTRDEAQAKVAPFIHRIGQYAAVRHEDVKALLGAEGFERLQQDAIRRLGPAAGTVYPWNVVDRLVIEAREELVEGSTVKQRLRCTW